MKTKLFIKKLSKLLFAGALLFTTFSCSDSDESSSITRYTVSFNSNGGSEIVSQLVESGGRAIQPASPSKENAFFAGWCSDEALTTKYSFYTTVTEDITLYAKWLEESNSSTTWITYDGEKIELDDHHWYLDASLKDDSLGTYTFNSIQNAAAGLPSGTADNPVVLYLAADVYWADDPDSEAVRAKEDLVGISFQQEYLTMRGISKNRNEVIICSNRGNNAGANGNFNTMQINTGFSAYDITFANYCNVDLVYERDASKSREKRQSAITQAQVLITWGYPDKLYFENCSFVSRLNLLSLYVHDRSYFKNCHFESTDDSLAAGKICVYENCDFDLYSGTPCATSSDYLESFLGCTFRPYMSGKITLSKGNTYFSFIDCKFETPDGYSPIKSIEFKQNETPSNTRAVIYNTTLDGNPLKFCENTKPYTEVTPDEEMLKSFKIGTTYNIYNLLNTPTLAEWLPSGQSKSDYVAPWAVHCGGASSLQADMNSTAVVTASAYGGGYNNLNFSLPDDESLLVFTEKNANSAAVRTKSSIESPIQKFVTAKTPNGIVGANEIIVTPAVSGTASFKTSPSLEISNGYINASYEIINGSQTENDLNPDESIVEWYRCSDSEGEAAIKVATSRYEEDDEAASPYKSYMLQAGDVGYFLKCTVTPKLRYSNKGTAESVFTTQAITESDVLEANRTLVTADFTHLVFKQAQNDANDKNYSWTNTMNEGFWYGGQYLVNDYIGDTPAYSSGSYKGQMGTSTNAWTYIEGTGGALDYYGFVTVARGARLVYIPTKNSCEDMNLSLKLAIEKSAGQGFGSANQFMEIYIKYDEATKTGYGLRIERMQAAPNGYENYADYLAGSCYFRLMSYKNGIASQLESGVFSVAFNTECTIELSYSNSEKLLKANVTTTKSKGSKYPDYMAESVNLSHTFEEANTASGFGIQHTGTVGEGGRVSLLDLKVQY